MKKDINQNKFQEIQNKYDNALQEEKQNNYFIAYFSFLQCGALIRTALQDNKNLPEEDKTFLEKTCLSSDNGVLRNKQILSSDGINNFNFFSIPKANAASPDKPSRIINPNL